MTTTIRDAFLQGMSRAAQTVNIVTTDGVAGRAGVTVSAMAAVSADAAHPTLLVCVHHATQAAPRIIENGTFCVNVLRDDQSYIADAFAGRFRDQLTDKFDVATWLPMPLGSPRVVDPLVAFDCQVSQQTRIGTHHVFMGEVQSVYVAPHGAPLIYADRAYGSPTRIDAATGLAARHTAAPNRLVMANLSGFGPLIVPELMTGLNAGGAVDLTLIEGDQRRVQGALHSGEVELALLLDHDLPEDLEVVLGVDLKPYVLMPSDHRLARHESLTPQDLAHCPFVLLNTLPLTGLALTLLRDAGIEPRIACRAGSVDMVRAMVGQNLGLAIVFLPAARPDLHDTKAIARPLTVTSRALRLVLCHRRGSELSSMADRFVRLAQLTFAQNA